MIRDRKMPNATFESIIESLNSRNVEIMGSAVQEYCQIVKRLAMGIVDHEVSDEAGFFHKLSEISNSSQLITCWNYLKEVFLI